MASETSSSVRLLISFQSNLDSPKVMSFDQEALLSEGWPAAWICVVGPNSFELALLMSKCNVVHEDDN